MVSAGTVPKRAKQVRWVQWHPPYVQPPTAMSWGCRNPAVMSLGSRTHPPPPAVMSSGSRNQAVMSSGTDFCCSNLGSSKVMTVVTTQLNPYWFCCDSVCWDQHRTTGSEQFKKRVWESCYLKMRHHIQPFFCRMHAAPNRFQTFDEGGKRTNNQKRVTSTQTNARVIIYRTLESTQLNYKSELHYYVIVVIKKHKVEDFWKLKSVKSFGLRVLNRTRSCTGN